MFCHSGSQHPHSHSTISCWALSTGNWVHNTLYIHHLWSSLHFREEFPEGIPGSEDRLDTQWLACSVDLADALDVWEDQQRSMMTKVTNDELGWSDFGFIVDPFVLPRSDSHVTGSAMSGNPTAILGQPFVALQLADDNPRVKTFKWCIIIFNILCF